MPKGDRLTPKQEAFCEHYVACGNATEAARKAGYKRPYPQGPENILKPIIKARVLELQKEIRSKRIATAEERQELYTEIMRDVDEQAKDRLKAAELLGKCQGDFIEKTQQIGADGKPVDPMPMKIEIVAKHADSSS